jgi:predicted dehydrogenase
MNSLRVALWGLGRHAVGKLLPAVAATPGLALAGVCSRNAARVTECAETWACQGWIDPELMLADKDVDVVYVATPIALHAEHGRRVVDAGKHLWCEKPLTGDASVAQSIVDLSRARGVAVCEGYMYLYHPQFTRLRGFLTGGRVGRVLSIVCRFGLPPLEHPGFRTRPELGGGALLDVGCYPVSTLVALLSQDSCAVRDASRLTRHGDVDTDGHATIECGNGAIAHLEWRIDASYRNDLEIWGDQGSLYTEKIFSKPADYVPVFRHRDRHGLETIERGEAADHFSLMLERFVTITRDEASIQAEGQATLMRSRLLEDIRQYCVAQETVEVMNAGLEGRSA